MIKEIGKMSKGWWIYLVFGILALGLGITMLCESTFAITFVSVIIGIYFLVSGGIGIAAVIIDREYFSYWGLKLAMHIMVFIAGILMISKPVFAISFLWFICGFGFMFDGVSMLYLSMQIKRFNVSWWIPLLIFGILAILASFLIMANPVIAISIVVVFAAFGAIFLGVSNIYYSIQVKKLNKLFKA